jgi:hypothetical protein
MVRDPRDIVTLVNTLGPVLGLARKTLSQRIFGQTYRVDWIDEGRDIGVYTFGRAMCWLSAHWPIELEWPREIERPSPTWKSLDDVPSLHKKRLRGN